MRIAFFGGSFDPPHQGHLAIAGAARQALALDTVLFAPVARQPLKPSGPSASFADRAAMTRLAIAADPSFELSLIDAPGSAPDYVPNYTYDTLIRLRNTLPADAQLYLLLGADSLLNLPQWHRAAEIPFLADLIVAARPRQDISNLSACLPPGIAIQPDKPNQYLLRNPQGWQASLTILPGLHYDIGATALRRQIHGQPSSEPTAIPAAVLQYIRSHHLYE